MQIRNGPAAVTVDKLYREPLNVKNNSGRRGVRMRRKSEDLPETEF